ncbi:PDZ domain-containing protein [Hazenella sp. IB182357]|uniref:PDZ domain-containing protein n=1 Tax=Polycladospora coralii TaxID=2771432 RepID=A0A926NBD9_9BACL|nr:PDZ domain-containing protein [Polycladospora coralii]MBD1372215.1 PDZ domain-containing protein [Polycladospora coralii]
MSVDLVALYQKWNVAILILLMMMFLSIIQIIWVYYAQKKELGKVVDSGIRLMVANWVWGGTISIGISAMIYYFNIYFNMKDLFVVGSLTLFFALIGVRFGCIAYAVGGSVLLSIAFEKIVFFQQIQWLDGINELFTNFDTLTWLWLVAILHLAEWLLIRIHGNSGLRPIKINHKRKQKINAFMMERGWPIPLITQVDETMICIPLFLGTASMNASRSMKQHRRYASTLTLFYAIGLLIGVTLYTWWISFPLWTLALYAVLCHEMVYQWGKWIEKRKNPLFSPDSNGLKVLQVSRKSTAAKMGLKAGDVILLVNGNQIDHPNDLIRFIRGRSTCKLDILDENGERQILQKTLFDGEPSDLGIIGIPSPENEEKKNYA